MEGNLYQGMTIHNLLEKVDLLNFMFDEDGEGGVKGTEKPSDVSKTVVRATDPTAAYLGLLQHLSTGTDRHLMYFKSQVQGTSSVTRSRWMT